MGLKVKDVLIIGVIAVASFPLLYVGMLFLTGGAKISLHHPTSEKIFENKKLNVSSLIDLKDSLQLAHSLALQAIEKEKIEIEEQKSRNQKQLERLQILQSQIDTQKIWIQKERETIQKLVMASDSLSMIRIKQLANVYAAMRPNEAARILETVDNSLLVKIMAAISDDKQKGKIMAALSQEKTDFINRQLGSKNPIVH